ncbi:MAG TPA: hypothetical protein VD996_12330 [Chitinophagaceae bacterium]|nr:hypothetical protein [Chitinophagaceae bacterium]
MNTALKDTALSPSHTRIPLVIISVLSLIYFANFFTPLRLTNDTVRYFNIKDWLEAGQPAGAPAGNDFLPHGYVWFLMLLSQLQIAKPFFIAAFHFLYLIGALWFVKRLLGSSFKFWHLAALCLLNWVTLKFVITPLSEMQFLFFSMGSLYFCDRSVTTKKAVHFVIALVFCIAAIITRTAGVVLLASFLITFFLAKRRDILNLARTSRLFIAGIIAGVVGVIILFHAFRVVSNVRDYAYYFEPFLKSPLSFIGNNIRNHLIDLSAISLNAPSSHLNFLGIPVLLLRLIYLVTGLLTLGWVFYLLFRRSNKVSLLIKVYLVCYTLLVLNWPFFEPRFWLPAVPLMMAVVLQEQKLTNSFTKYFLSAYRLVYILVGFTALGYYTYTSHNKKALSVKQDAGVWKNEYETYFFGKPQTDTTAVIREPIMNILKKYQ